MTFSVGLPAPPPPVIVIPFDELTWHALAWPSTALETTHWSVAPVAQPATKPTYAISFGLTTRCRFPCASHAHGVVRSSSTQNRRSPARGLRTDADEGDETPPNGNSHQSTRRSTAKLLKAHDGSPLGCSPGVERSQWTRLEDRVRRSAKLRASAHARRVPDVAHAERLQAVLRGQQPAHVRGGEARVNRDPLLESRGGEDHQAGRHRRCARRCGHVRLGVRPLRDRNRRG